MHDSMGASVQCLNQHACNLVAKYKMDRQLHLMRLIGLVHAQADTHVPQYCMTGKRPQKDT